MPEQRIVIRPTDFLDLESHCPRCKNVTAISLNPPTGNLDQSPGTKARRGCMWCEAAFPLGTDGFIEEIQQAFSVLQDYRDLDLRLVVKQ